MSTTETNYTARQAQPQYLERGRQQVSKLPIYRDGALAEPSAGTYSLYDSSGGAVLDAVAVTVSGSVAQYTISAGTLPASLDVGDRWLEEWALVMPDGVTHTFRRPAALVLRRLYPVATDADLEAQYRDLGSALMPSAITSWQEKLDEAWLQIMGRLIGAGNLPYLIMDPYALREVHVDLTLSIIFKEFHSSTGDSRWMESAQHHRVNYEKGWARLNFRYDTDHDGSISSEQRQSAAASLWLTDTSAADRRIRGLPWRDRY